MRTTRDAPSASPAYQLVGLAALAFSLCGCGTISYVAQAARGQYELYRRARPLDEVRNNPCTPSDRKKLLDEIPHLREFAQTQGLNVRNNYRQFVQLDRDHVVWFVNASAPLAFEPKTFWFPIIGSFPGLGWFDENDAKGFAETLRSDGWDVSLRGVSAFSTGGWFEDPLVSSMLQGGDSALGRLVNVILHESVHATVLLKNQQYFNESLASFVADTMTPQYLGARYGKHSVEYVAYEDNYIQRQRYGKQFIDTYDQLNELYRSRHSAKVKLERKSQLLWELSRELDLEHPANNATLIGARLYGIGTAEFGTLLDRCAGNWRRFLPTSASLGAEGFRTDQQENFGSIVTRLADKECLPEPSPEVAVPSEKPSRRPGFVRRRKR